MARENPLVHVSSALSQLARGSVLDFLRHDSFPAWIDLASISLLEQELAALATTDDGTLRQQFRFSQVLALAQRLILSRQTNLLSVLRPLWRAFGASDESCASVVSATQSALADWPSEVCQACDAATFSPALAAFTKTLRDIANSDAAGVLGTAIRRSRIADERPHVGFPLVLRGNCCSNLRSGIWVSPNASPTPTSGGEIESAWRDICSRVRKIVYGDKSSGKPDWSLPDWLLQLAGLDGWSVETLDSAGLGLAMQMLARQAKVNLPFGVGFTGRWDGGQLQGVRDLAIKLQAAREAGVFLLFGCADQDHNESLPEPIEGIRLVLLPEGLCLKDVVRCVNRACADSGLTEFRWREAQRRFRDAAATTTAHSPNLPEALDDALCPVGFVGRDNALASLQQEISKQHTSRRLLAVTAPPRSGKTTLLSRFASQQTPYPIWFSFRRGQASRQTLAQLQDAVCDQMAARFGTVLLPTQVSSGNVSNEERLTSLVDAICGPVSLLVDGIDEAQSPKDVIDWLQTIPGAGLSLVGSQPIEILNQSNCTQISLQNDTESGKEDARSLIARFSTRFTKVEHLKPIADQLQQNDWIDGLCEKSGGNLWVLTQFLSNVERDQAGWPASPSEAPLSPNVREYCQTLMAAALADYQGDNRSRAETFLAFRSYLDNRAWRVQDVLRLAGNFLNGAPFDAWGGTGLLASSSRRVLEFDGTHCRFWSPLTREAVRNNYMTYASDVSRRFIDLLQNDESQDDLLDHVTESVPSLLVEVSNAELTRTLLFESPWIHRRARLLVRQHHSVGTLRAELMSLTPSLPSDRAGDVRRLVDWLIGWGWAVDDSPDLIDQWWDAASEVMQPFPRVKGAHPVTTGDCCLLAPIVGPSVTDARYDIPWPASPQFHGAACEILEGSTSRLVFVASRNGGPGDLLVYRAEGSDYVRERFIRLPEDERVFSLASLPYPEVAALVRLPNGGCELKVFDVRSGQSHTLLADSNIVDLETLSAEPARLLVVRCESVEDGPSTCTLRVLDAQSHQVADALLPFVRSVSADIKIVPFGTDCFCVLGHPQPQAPREMRLYRLESTSGTGQIAEIQPPVIATVNGACALPNRRLAVTHRGSAAGSSLLSVVKEDGQIELSIPLYASPPQTGRRYSLNHATIGSFLLHCQPVAWHTECGIVLTSDHDHGVYAVQMEPEAIPNELPRTLSRALDTGDSTTSRERAFGISGGRALFAFSTGAVVLGPNREDMVRIEGGARAEITTEIVGSRADGAILICDGYTNPDNDWSRDNYRFAIPPFESPSSGEVPLGPDVCMTLDGWELGWSSDECTLLGRRAAGQPEFRWNAAEFFGGVTLRGHHDRILESLEGVAAIAESSELGQSTERESDLRSLEILDVIPRPPQGGAWVAVKHGRSVFAVLLSFNDHDAQPRVFCLWNDEEKQNIRVQFLDASGNLLVYCVINDAREPIDNGTPLNSVVRFLSVDWHGYESFHDNAPVTVRHLAANASLILRMPNFGRGDWASGWPHAPATVFVHHPETGIVERPDLTISRTLTVLRREEQGDESYVRLASIIERDRRWTLEVCALRIDSSLGTVTCQSVMSTELAGEVTCWGRSDDYLAIVYANGRVEVRDCRRPGMVVAVCFTNGRPRDVAVIRRPEGLFVVVSEGERLTWFPLAL